jgi:hypothetical protein
MHKHGAVHMQSCRRTAAFKLKSYAFIQSIEQKLQHCTATTYGRIHHPSPEIVTIV